MHSWKYFRRLHPECCGVNRSRPSVQIPTTKAYRPYTTSHKEHQDKDLFKHTSRRWIFNESDRLKERYVEFNPVELLREAGKALHRSCPSSIIKMAEGGFNRIFLIQFDDGEDVIARIPTPIAGPPRYTTASEVATLDWLRNVIGIPVPKVLAYSATSDNPVGAEYMLMERVKGDSLASRWLSLTTDEVKDIMTQIGTMEQRISSFKFPGYGSLYYKGDIRDESRIPIANSELCIGPLACRQFWHGIRGQFDVDRGPWHSPMDCLTSAARRELACTMGYAKPQPRRMFLMPTDYDIDPSEHVHLLSSFIDLASKLLPEDSYLSRPVLKHPDLSLNNIFLDPGSTKIVSVIDWQDAKVFPHFMQAGYPELCEHDTSKPQSLHIPELPPDFDFLPAEKQAQAKAKLRLEEANLYYTAATGLYNEEAMRVLRLPCLGMRQYLIQQTGYPWDADLINLRAALVGITSPGVWGSISSDPCPVSFTDEERHKAMGESREWNESEEILRRVRDHLGIDAEGGTEPENFEWASTRSMDVRMEMVRQAEEHERELCWNNWPYNDASRPFPHHLLKSRPKE